MMINPHLLMTLFYLSTLRVEGFTLSRSKVSLLSDKKSPYAIKVLSSKSYHSEPLKMSDWGDFKALEDDDDPLYNDAKDINDNIGYADENDSQELKAEVGSMVAGPSMDWKGEPLFLPQGSVIPLDEESVQAILAACRIEIGTMFGYTAENRGVGITGGVDFLYLDGPNIVLSLKGRFWHQRPTVLDRVGAYIRGRIPEVVDVIVEDEWELTDEANNLAT